LFHPIHVFLNTKNMKQYIDYKHNKSIFFKNKNKGINIFYNRLLTHIKDNKISTKFLTE
jgi:hypothetical protein